MNNIIILIQKLIKISEKKPLPWLCIFLMTKKKEKSSKNVLRVFLEISFFLILSEISISIFHSLLILLSPRMCLWSSRWYRCKRWKNHTGNEINQSVRCGVWGTMWIEGKMAEIESCTSQHANERKKKFHFITEYFMRKI